MRDAQLFGHATTAAGISWTASTVITGPTIDLVSNSRRQTFLATLRVGGATGTTGILSVKAQVASAGTTFVDFPLEAGTTGASIFPVRTASDYGGTETTGVAAAPVSVAIRPTRRFLRFVFTSAGTTAAFSNVTLTLDPMPNDPGVDAPKGN